jgi:hypothetical protein
MGGAGENGASDGLTTARIIGYPAQFSGLGRRTDKHPHGDGLGRYQFSITECKVSSCHGIAVIKLALHTRNHLTTSKCDVETLLLVLQPSSASTLLSRASAPLKQTPADDFPRHLAATPEMGECGAQPGSTDSRAEANPLTRCSTHIIFWRRIPFGARRTTTSRAMPATSYHGRTK